MIGVASELKTPRATCSAFWLCFWLAVLLIVTKAVHLGLPSQSSLGGLMDYASDLAIMSHADVMFALGVGLVGQLALRLSVRRPSIERITWAGLVFVCVLSVVYAIVSVQIFAYLRTPLTYPLIYLAGDMKNMRSSVGAFLTPQLVTALAAGPPLYLFAAWVTHRNVQPTRTPWFRAGQALGLVTVACCCLVARMAFAGPWSERNDRRIAENPHWVLVASLLTELIGERTVELRDEFPPDDLGDFETVAERSLHAEMTGDAADETAIRNPFSPTQTEFFAGETAAAGRTDRPKNVILYVLESVGTQHLGVYGSRYPTTPRLDAEAANSLVFDNCYAHVGITANSLVAITLSAYPGMSWREFTVEQPDLPGTTLAEMFRARGYRTAFVTSGDITWVKIDQFLQHRGFDVLWDYRDIPCSPLITSWGVEDRCLVDSMLQWMDQARDRPFYLMTWTQQTHHPYEPSRGRKPIEFFHGELPPDDYDLGRYLNVLPEADEQLGRLFDALRRRGLADDTLVVITGDHGEGFGAPHKTYGHGGKIYEENVHVPLILWNPRLRHAGQRIETVGSHIDVSPTVSDMLGIPASASWQGRSLFDPARPPRAYFYAAMDDYLLGVREHNWKYIYNATVGRENLFDLSRDPTEQSNLATDQPDQCRLLRQRLAAWIEYEERHLADLRGSAERSE